MNNRQLYFLFTSLLGVALPVAFPFIPLFDGGNLFEDLFAYFGGYETNGELFLYLVLTFLAFVPLLTLLRGFFLLAKKKNWKAILISDLVALVGGLVATVVVLSQGGNVAFLFLFPSAVVLPLLMAAFDQRLAREEISPPGGR